MRDTHVPPLELKGNRCIVGGPMEQYTYVTCLGHEDFDVRQTDDEDSDTQGLGCGLFDGERRGKALGSTITFTPLPVRVNTAQEAIAASVENHPKPVAIDCVDAERYVMTLSGSLGQGIPRDRSYPWLEAAIDR